MDKTTIIPYSANESNVEALKDALMEFTIVDNKAKLTLFKFQDIYRTHVWNALMGNIITVVYALNNDTLENKC